ncbi:MAG: ribonuclease E/G [Pseudomonadota bacterium]
MAKKMLIDATHPEETRVVVVDGNKVDDFDFESINKRQLAGNIYLAKVTRVEPSLQAAFVDYGGNRHGFLAFSEIHPDYYQIPVADREALLAEEAEAARAESDDESREDAEQKPRKPRRSRGSRKSKAAAAEAGAEIAGLEVISVEGEGAEGGAEEAPALDATGPDSLAVVAPDEAIAADETPAAEPETDVAAATEEAAQEAPEQDVDDAKPEAEPETASAEDTPEPPKTMAEDTGLDDESVSEEIKPATEEAEAPAPKKPRRRRKKVEPEAEAPEEAKETTPAEEESEVPAEASEETPDEEGEAEKPARKRRTRSRRRKDADDGDTAPEGEAEKKDEVESVGAEDLQEEVARARSQRRRRYKIQDVVKVRQIMLVQVVKEERGNKGAALTTYLSLAGRYCVLMPNTARGGGISRKITHVGDRKRLREIVDELEVPKGMGLIVRTAGAERTRAEIKRDYEFLSRQWESVRDLTLKSIAPTLIYEEGSLIKRSIRDLYSKEIDTIHVEGDAGYREAKDYMKMLMPSHAKNVQQYSDSTPLYARYQVETYLNGMFSPTVQLKSGGYIVIDVTEALVAVDVNSGRATKQGSIEETALHTNLEAADEVAMPFQATSALVLGG